MLAWSHTPIFRKIQGKEWKGALSFHGKRSETSLQTLLESKGLDVTLGKASITNSVQPRLPRRAKREPKQQAYAVRRRAIPKVSQRQLGELYHSPQNLTTERAPKGPDRGPGRGSVRPPGRARGGRRGIERGTGSLGCNFRKIHGCRARHERRGERDGTEQMPAARVGRAPDAAARAVDGVRTPSPRDALSVRPKLGGGGVGGLILSRKR